MSILQQITTDTAAEVERRMAQVGLSQIRQQAEQQSQQTPARDFERSLATAIAEQRYPVISEIKRKSPSKGVLCDPFDVAAIARAYSENGASCLSVLTDTPYFGGTLDDLITAKQHSHLPAIRKDFMLCEWQIYESRAIGADAVLLIAAVLDDAVMQELANIALSLSMAVIVEVHDAAEMERALRIPNVLIGINNRNLKTFVVDIQTTVDLLPAALAENRFVIAESGIHNSSQVQQLLQAGAHAFLIGESIVNNPAQGLRQLFGSTEGEA